MLLHFVFVMEIRGKERPCIALLWITPEKYVGILRKTGNLQENGRFRGTKSGRQAVEISVDTVDNMLRNCGKQWVRRGV